MKEIKKEVTKEQIVYEITKEELEAIKRKERIGGRNDILGYMRFSIKFYRYKLNIRGMELLIENLIDFVSGKTNIIENACGYSLHDYVSYMEK